MEMGEFASAVYDMDASPILLLTCTSSCSWLDGCMEMGEFASAVYES
jgi:hypothetical protein